MFVFFEITVYGLITNHDKCVINGSLGDSMSDHTNLVRSGIHTVLKVTQPASYTALLSSTVLKQKTKNKNKNKSSLVARNAAEIPQDSDTQI